MGEVFDWRIDAGIVRAFAGIDIRYFWVNGKITPLWPEDEIDGMEALALLDAEKAQDIIVERVA